MLKLHLTSKCILVTAIGIGWLWQIHESASASFVTRESMTASQVLPQDDWSFWPTDQAPAPRKTSNGSTRAPSCVNDELQALTPHDELQALTPHEQIGLTSRARPDILIYAPAKTADSQAVFMIRSQDDFHHVASVSLPETAAIVSLPLPADIPDLAAGKQYQWSLVLSCTENLGPSSPRLSGWLETSSRLDDAALQIEPSLEQATRYRDQRLWYDMIATLAQLKIGHPEDVTVQQAWLNVLERHHLGNLADASLL